MWLARRWNPRTSYYYHYHVITINQKEWKHFNSTVKEWFFLCCFSSRDNGDFFVFKIRYTTLKPVKVSLLFNGQVDECVAVLLCVVVVIPVTVAYVHRRRKVSFSWWLLNFNAIGTGRDNAGWCWSSRWRGTAFMNVTFCLVGYISVTQLPQWATEDPKIKAPFVENSKVKDSPFKA